MIILHPGIVVKAQSLGLLHKKTKVTVFFALLSVLSGEVFQIEERKEKIPSSALPHFVALYCVLLLLPFFFFFKENTHLVFISQYTQSPNHNISTTTNIMITGNSF